MTTRCPACTARVTLDPCYEPVSDACTGPDKSRDNYHPEWCAVCPICGRHGDNWGED